MKKIGFIIMSTLLVGALTAYGQDQGKGGNKVGGIRAGWHYAVLEKEGGKPDTANALNSFYVGFFRSTKLIPLLHFGSGIEYFQNGMSYTNNTDRILHTISVPLDLRLKLGPVFVLGGVAANFKVSEKIKIGGESINPLEADKTNWFDVPVFLGAGLKIFFVTIEARYHWGLLEARNGYHNQYFQLGAGISF
jgi:hypothetical protein